MPGGASSSDIGTAAAVDEGVTDDKSDPGSIKRMLEWILLCRNRDSEGK